MERERSKNACERGHVYPRMERLCVGERAVQECVRFTHSVSSAEGRPVLFQARVGAPKLCEGYSLRRTGGYARPQGL